MAFMTLRGCGRPSGAGLAYRFAVMFLTYGRCGGAVLETNAVSYPTDAFLHFACYHTHAFALDLDYKTQNQDGLRRPNASGRCPTPTQCWRWPCRKDARCDGGLCADAVGLVQTGGRPKPRKTATKATPKVAKRDRQPKTGQRPHTPPGMRQGQPSAAAHSQATLLRARRMGGRLHDLVAAAPPGYAARLHRDLVGKLLAELRQRLREAHILGHVLTAHGGTASSSSTATEPDAQFVSSLVTANLGTIHDFLHLAAAVPSPSCAWPSSESQLLALAPELRQLCTWAMMLGDSEDEPDDHVSNDAAPDAPSGTKSSDGDDADDLQLVAVDGQEQTSLLQRLLTVAPTRATSGSLSPATAEQPNAAVDVVDHLPGVILVQTIMELGSDGEAEIVDTAPAVCVDNREPRLLTVDDLLGHVDRTLGLLWDRGDDYLVRTLAFHLWQAGQEMVHDCDDHYLAFALAAHAREYLASPMLRDDIPSTRWREWFDEVSQHVREHQKRARRARTPQENVNDPLARFRDGANDNNHQRTDVVDLLQTTMTSQVQALDDGWGRPSNEARNQRPHADQRVMLQRLTTAQPLRSGRVRMREALRCPIPAGSAIRRHGGNIAGRCAGGFDRGLQLRERPLANRPVPPGP